MSFLLVSIKIQTDQTLIPVLGSVVLMKNDLNIVIFFTHVDHKCAFLQKNSLKFLHIHEATRVKVLTELFPRSSKPKSNFNLQHCAECDEPLPTEKPKHGSEFCKELLKDSLMSLTHYCHTVMKMKTGWYRIF